jgi:transposase
VSGNKIPLGGEWKYSAESDNSVDKRRFPWILKKRLAWRKANESFLRRNIYNIRQYHNLMHLQPSLIEKLSE